MATGDSERQQDHSPPSLDKGAFGFFIPYAGLQRGEFYPVVVSHAGIVPFGAYTGNFPQVPSSLEVNVDIGVCAMTRNLGEEYQAVQAGFTSIIRIKEIEHPEGDNTRKLLSGGEPKEYRS